MTLGCSEQRCRNRFLAEVGSGDRPVLGVFHKISCHQTNAGTLIRKDSNHVDTSPNFTVQPLDHIGRGNFSSIQLGKCVKSQRIFQFIFKVLNYLVKALGVDVNHVIYALPDELCRGRQLDFLQRGSKGFLLFLPP